MASTEQRLRSLISTNHPDFTLRSLKIVGEGLDNIAVELNRNLIVRFAKREHDKAFQSELSLIQRLAPILMTKIPIARPEIRGVGYFAYQRIPGVPLIAVIDRLDSDWVSAICKLIAAFLSELHSIGTEGFMDLLPLEDEPFDRILNGARDGFESVKGSIPRHFHTRIEEFFGSPLPMTGSHQTLLHNDFGIEHMIVEIDSGITFGVIDWTDAAIGDPAIDFAKIYRDLGEDGLREVFSGYQNKTEPFEGMFSRIAFYAKCSIFEEMEFGRNRGHEIYLTRAVRALSWLFPPQNLEERK